MSGYSDANMLLAVILVLGSLSSASARQLSIFQLAFEEPPRKVLPQEFLGATPADTYPLVLTPLNFAPGVVAPPTFLFPSPIRFPSIGSISNVRGAIPLFAPLQPFPYVRYLPVKTSFYLAEPNLRDPLQEEDPVVLPFKQGAPKPAFSPIRDTQVVRKPTQESIKYVKENPEEVKFIRAKPFPSTDGALEDILNIPVKHGAPRPAFSPVRDTQVVIKPSQETILNVKQNPEEAKFIREKPFPSTDGALEDTLNIPVKHGAPRPAFSPVRDTQVVMKPSQETTSNVKQNPEEVKFIREKPFPSTDSALEDILNIPVKHGAPRPATSPVRDAQIVRMPTKYDTLKAFSRVETPVRKEMKHDQQIVRVAHFPTEIGGGNFAIRGVSDLTLSAPGGIVQSGQPHFTFEPFSNSKLSHNLITNNAFNLKNENEEQEILPTVIDC